MKKLFSLLLLAMLTMSAWAATTVTIDFSQQGFENAAAVTEVIEGAVTVTFDGGTNANNAPKYYSSGTSVRLYAGNTMAVAVAGDENITKIEFTYSQGDWSETSVDCGTYANSAWTGDAATINFTNDTDGQVRIQKMVVTIGEGEVPGPGPDPDPEGVVTFDGTNDIPGVGVNNNAFTLTKGVVTFAVSKGTCESTTGHYRIFKGQTATFTSTGADIVKIEFTCTAEGDAQYGPGCFTANIPTYTYSGAKGTWEGKASEVVFTAETNQVRATTIVVTLDDGTSVVVAVPTFSPAAQEFEESIDVTLAAEEGATIYYNYDNGETWNEYTQAIHLTETTTIYAKAEKDGVESSVVSATYTLKPAATEVESLEIAADMEGGLDFIFTGEAVVTYQYNQYLFVRDDTGYGLIYGATNGGENPVFAQGTVLTPGWEAKTQIYNNELMEFVSATGLDSCGMTTVAPEMITADQMADKLNAYVQIDHVKSISGTTATLTDGTTITLYNRFGKTIQQFSDADAIITGIVNIYNGVLQLYYIDVEGIVAAPTLPASCNFEGSMAVEITNNEEGATVMYSTDGTNWNEYTEALTITETTTVQAKAVKSGKESTVVSATYTKVEPVTYTLVTNVAELAAGDKIILVGFHNVDSVYAMANAKANNFAAVAVNVVDNTITTSLANVVTLEANSNGFWNFKTDGGYLYANGSDSKGSNNWMKLEDEVDADGYADATISMVNDTTIIEFQGGNDSRFMRFNDSKVENILFSCYKETSSVKKPVYIFKAQSEPAFLRGDVNGDEDVSIADVAALIDILLGSGDASKAADCDLNGEVGIADVTCLIDYLLSGNWPAK